MKIALEALTNQLSARSVPPETRGERLARAAVFGSVAVTYLAYLVIYASLPCGFAVFRPPDVCTVFQSFLVLFPLYAAVLWHWRREISLVDLNIIYAPMCAWYATFVVSGGKALSNFILESTCVGLILGIYLLRFPIAQRLDRSCRTTIALTFLLVVCALAVLVGFVMPPIRD